MEGTVGKRDDRARTKGPETRPDPTVWTDSSQAGALVVAGSERLAGPTSGESLGPRQSPRLRHSPHPSHNVGPGQAVPARPIFGHQRWRRNMAWTRSQWSSDAFRL